MVKFVILFLACVLAVTAVSAQDGQAGTFTVIVSSNANLRSCASTTCSIAGRATQGDVLTVLETDDGWYHVRTEEGDTAYIADFLVTRGPDEIIDLDEWYTDREAGCEVLVESSRGSMDMVVIIAGDRQDDVVVDLYRPNETRALPVEGQLLKEFIDTKELYIHQYYGWNIGWPFGMYNLEYSIDDLTRRLGFEIEDRGEYLIRVNCGDF